MASVSNPDDEITTYEDMRTVGASEAFWRLYEFKIHERWPKCMSLSIHL